MQIHRKANLHIIGICHIIHSNTSNTSSIFVCLAKYHIQHLYHGDQFCFQKKPKGHQKTAESNTLPLNFFSTASRLITPLVSSRFSSMSTNWLYCTVNVLLLNVIHGQGLIVVFVLKIYTTLTCMANFKQTGCSMIDFMSRLISGSKGIHRTSPVI